MLAASRLSSFYEQLPDGAERIPALIEPFDQFDSVNGFLVKHASPCRPDMRRVDEPDHNIVLQGLTRDVGPFCRFPYGHQVVFSCQTNLSHTRLFLKTPSSARERAMLRAWQKRRKRRYWFIVDAARLKKGRYQIEFSDRAFTHGRRFARTRARKDRHI